MHKFAGFTLLELLMVILIVGILIAISVPYFKRSNQPVVSRVSQTLQQHLSFAKSIALESGETVALCGSSDGVRCDDRWEKGYRIFSTKSGTGWLYHRLEHDSLQIKWRGFLSRNTPQFSPTLALSGQNGSFKICRSGEASSKIIISPTGRLRTVSGKTCA